MSPRRVLALTALLGALLVRPVASADGATPGLPLIPPAPAGPTGGDITGLVRNGTTAQPTPGVLVQLVLIGAQGPQVAAETRSDARGRFAFRGLVDGRYLLQARYQGVSYAAHAVLSGGAAADVVVQVFDASPRVPLRLGLLGVAVDVRAGYLRVSEVAHLQNPTTRTLLGEVIIPLPRGARYVTFLEGFHQPRAQGAQITDRLIVRPGGHQLAYAYSLPGSGEVSLDRRVVWPTDRVEVFVTAPADVRSPRLQPTPAVTDEDGRTFARASGRAVPPGDLPMSVIGVPDARLWTAPAAAGTLAAVLTVGLMWAMLRGGVVTGAQNP
ncbi:MAG: carboxypeptidase-like regulatory domain-containing protein [Armatimonadota bacterium]|nr:carboxypeptidase-like regulatory domain-containing protein [Armatimonadota bacterium]MDR7520624.1 carboxypeptidase-like regulatory domain-containing protein [Armatimonadota bacterium]MDR7550483.1 carboxypeptidase-like regulatory domain-containing protein [Armatimonadota bacterium]